MKKSDEKEIERRAAIVESLAHEVETADTEELKEQAAIAVRSARDAGFVETKQANELLAQLGADLLEEYVPDAKTEYADLKAYAGDLDELKLKLRSARMEYAEKHNAAKEAKKVVDALEDQIMSIVDEGARGYKSGKLF